MAKRLWTPIPWLPSVSWESVGWFHVCSWVRLWWLFQLTVFNFCPDWKYSLLTIFHSIGQRRERLWVDYLEGALYKYSIILYEIVISWRINNHPLPNLTLKVNLISLTTCEDNLLASLSFVLLCPDFVLCPNLPWFIFCHRYPIRCP